MTEKKADAPVTAQSFDPARADESKLTAEEQKAADAKTEDDALREKLARKAEAARFVRVNAKD